MISGIIYLLQKSNISSYDSSVGLKNKFGKYSGAYKAAENYRNSLDKFPEEYSKDAALKNYETFLRTRIKCPTVADTALAMAQKERYINLPFLFEKHKGELEKMPPIDSLFKTAEGNLDKDYSKTRYLREKLISLGRINLNGIEPKLNGFKKKMLKFKLFLY